MQLMRVSFMPRWVNFSCACGLFREMPEESACDPMKAPPCPKCGQPLARHAFDHDTPYGSWDPGAQERGEWPSLLSDSLRPKPMTRTGTGASTVQDAARRPKGKEAWRDDPATEKQLAFLRRLGQEPAPGLSKGEARDAISFLVEEGQEAAIRQAMREDPDLYEEEDDDDGLADDADTLSPASAPRVPGNPVCSACGGEMKKSKHALGSSWGCLFLIIGAVLCTTLIGAVLGIPAILYGLHLGMKRTGVWRCLSCSTEIPRAISWHEWG